MKSESVSIEASLQIKVNGSATPDVNDMSSYFDGLRSSFFVVERVVTVLTIAVLIAKLSVGKALAISKT